MKHIKKFNESDENIFMNDNEKTSVKCIDELINFLQTIKDKYGDLPIMREYEGDYWIGTDVEVCKNIDEFTGCQTNDDVVYIH